MSEPNAIVAAVMTALSDGMEVKFIPSGQNRFIFVLINSQTKQGIDVEVPIGALAHPDAFVKQYLLPALAQFAVDATRS